MKKTNKLMLLPFCLMAIGCNEESPVSTTSSQEPIDYSNPVLINGYENVSDLYRSKLVYPYSSLGLNCTFDINTNQEYVKTGTGSLKMNMAKASNGDYSYYVQRIDQSIIKDSDIADIDNFSMWIYNANNEDTTVTMGLIAKDYVATTFEDKTLTKNSWNYIEFNLSKLIVSNSVDSLIGFGILINQLDGTYYLDDWSVKFGATYTDADKEVLSTIEEINSLVKPLPETSDFKDESTRNKLEEVASKYYQVDQSYRHAVVGYEKLEKLCSSYTDYLNEQSAANGTPKAFNFSNPAGVSQISFNAQQIGVSTSFDPNMKDSKDSNAKGSLHIKMTGGTKWTYAEFKSNSSPNDYTNFSFSAYNDSDDIIAFCISWNALAQYIHPRSWATYQYSCRGLSGDVQFEFCSVTETVGGGNMATTGDLYLSDFYLQ